MREIKQYPEFNYKTQLKTRKKNRDFIIPKAEKFDRIGENRGFYSVLACWISASRAFRESLKDNLAMASEFPSNEQRIEKQKR